MAQLSYKQYLNFISSYKKASPVGKIITNFLLIATILIVGISAISAAIYFRDIPKVNAKNYLEFANNSFITTQGSVSSLLESFQVAGARVQALDTYKESSASASGFLVSLKDVEKSLDALAISKKIIGAQVAEIKTRDPEKYTKLKNDILAYENSSISVLDKVEVNAKFQRDLITILGSSFYIPSFSDESIWKEKNNDKIVEYYEKTKTESEYAQKQLQTITPPQEYQKYYGLQQVYLQEIKLTSENILATLKDPEDANRDNASQLEKAYQILQGAKFKNEKLTADLLVEKLKLFQTKTNLEKLADVRLKEASIKTELDEEIVRLPSISEVKVPPFLNKLIGEN